MIRIASLVIALCALIYVRATTLPAVPIWSPWWWVWIFATIVVSACVGWVSHEERDHRRR